MPTRLRAARVLAWVMVAVASIGLFGLADLMVLPGWVDQQYVWAVSLEASWGSLLTFVVAGSFSSIALNPRQPWPGIVLLAIAVGALVLGAVFGQDGSPVWVAALLAGAVAVLVWLVQNDSPALPRIWNLSWQYLLIGLAGVPLWLFYVLHAFDKSRLRQDAEHQTWNVEHWPVQGSAGITLCLSALVMSFWVAGRPLMRVTTSLSATYIGAAMLAFPHRDGAMEGPMWGVAMVLWGTVLALPLPRRATSLGPPSTASG